MVREELAGIALANGALECVVLPALGAKIASLRSRATAREWLWRNPHLAYRRAEPGDSYVALHDTGGIDECFPNIAPSDSLPDHGELYSQAWTIEERGERRLALSARGARYRFRRVLELARAAPRLELAYEVENRSERPLEFVWCLHALLAVEPGMRIELPEATPIRVASRSGALPADPLRVPERAAPPFAAKLFAGPLARGELALRGADPREALRLRFDPAAVPFAGLWLNYGGWSGAGTAPYWNAALEPSIGDADELEAALARGTAARIAPGARRSWRIAIELGP